MVGGFPETSWNPLKYPCPFLSHLEGKQGNKKTQPALNPAAYRMEPWFGWNQQSAPQQFLRLLKGLMIFRYLSGRKFGHEKPVDLSGRGFYVMKNQCLLPGSLMFFLVGEKTVTIPAMLKTMPPARQPHGDLDRRQSDQYLGTPGNHKAGVQCVQCTMFDQV